MKAKICFRAPFIKFQILFHIQQSNACNAIISSLTRSPHTDFDGGNYAQFEVFHKAIGLFSLLFIIPVFNRGLKWHETSILFWITLFLGGSYFGTAFVTRLWPDYYFVSLLGFAQISLYCTNRSLITRFGDF